jgi:formylglycine-generating enzyme required for sulfatase activity
MTHLLHRARTLAVAGLLGAAATFAAPVEWPVDQGGNGHFYELIEHPEGMTWHEARNEAHELWHGDVRGHLATITSAAESDFIIAALLTGAPHNHYYLGGFQSDGAQEPGGDWEWITGEPWSYTNWGGGEPNDNNGIEDVLEAYGPDSPKFGEWNDIPYDTSGGPDPFGGYLVEWPAEPPVYAETLVNPANGHTYYVSTDMMTAPVAEAWARSLGAHLVTVSDQAENDWLHDTLATYGYTHFWIGLTDEEGFGGSEAGDDPNGDWVWMSGEPVDYLNWNAGEPNGATYPGQDYVEMHISGNWNDLENITLRRGVAEISPAFSDLVLIPGGEFEMGDHYDVGEGDELPVHPVYVDSFHMSVYETTNTEYVAYLNAAYNQGLIEVTNGVVYKAGDTEPYCDTTGASSDSRIEWDDDTFTNVPGKDDHPMVQVSWYGAAAYANWRSVEAGLQPTYDLDAWECDFTADGYRLPTEAEWEYAARGGEHDPYYKYPWGNTIDGSHANYEGSGDPYDDGPPPETTPVGYYDGGQMPPGVDMANGYGLYDMVGNVWEWCHDWRDANFYSSSPYDNPHGPDSGSVRILRGGSWIHYDFEHALRCANRGANGPDHRDNDYGFRLVRPMRQVQETLIPGGEFEMGDQYDIGGSDERPVHNVYIDSFYMAIYETTNADYVVFLNAAYADGTIEVRDGTIYKSGDTEPYCETTGGSIYSRIIWDGNTFSPLNGKELHPMTEVSWYGAAAYANWRSSEEGRQPAYDLGSWICDFGVNGYRLPTEAEWEYAARGGEHSPYYKYPWGNTIAGSHANYWASGDPYETGPYPWTTPVGYYDGGQSPPGVDMANGYGLYDMAGNVWAWCNDWYSSTYYASSPYANPKGPSSGTNRVLRDGSWGADPINQRCAFRNWISPSYLFYTIGFRLVRPAMSADGSIHVDDDAAAGGDGLTWDSAFKHLQDALDAAEPGDTIKVAQGTYRPDESEAAPNGTGDREMSFEPLDGMTLEGGYAGLGADDPDARDVVLYETILDGDLNEDDLPDFGNRTDNARHILFAGGTLDAVTIDGFTIRGGFSDEDSTDPLISGGSGLYCSASMQTVRNCSFLDNHTGRTGGAFYTRHGSVLLEDCRFEGNAGGFGAGLNSFSGDVTVRRCIFAGNDSAWHGGAIANEADLTLVNSLLTRNSAALGSGAISTAGNVSIINSTITQNHAPEVGGIKLVWWTESASVANTILWGNTNNVGGGQNGQISEQSGQLDINYSCVEGWTGGLGGVGNTGDDPMFVDELGPDGLPGTGDEDHRLRTASTCVDAGNNDAIAEPIDLDGNERFVDHPGVGDTGQGDAPLIDMGAYEWQMTDCWAADLSGDGQINQTDLGLLLAWYDAGDGGDVDGDGDTDQGDLGILLAHYGEVCE